jgi:hypothetical protein
MVSLSATICSDEDDALRQVTAMERTANRAAILNCVRSAVAAGELRGDTDVVGLSALFDGILNGLSIQARDGVPAAKLDAAISAALTAWDGNLARALS